MNIFNERYFFQRYLHTVCQQLEDLSHVGFRPPEKCQPGYKSDQSLAYTYV